MNHKIYQFMFIYSKAAEDAKVAPAVYGHPNLYHNPLVALPHTVKPVAAVPSTVGHLGYPYAGVFGHKTLLGASHYVVKREAEAAPEASYGYGFGRSYGGYGRSYGGYGGHRFYGGYGRSYGYGYGK